MILWVRKSGSLGILLSLWCEMYLAAICGGWARLSTKTALTCLVPWWAWVEVRLRGIPRSIHVVTRWPQEFSPIGHAPCMASPGWRHWAGEVSSLNTISRNEVAPIHCTLTSKKSQANPNSRRMEIDLTYQWQSHQIHFKNRYPSQI